MRRGCKFCDKHGLPILLTRYAISPENAYTAPLPDNLKPHLKTKSGDPGAVAPDMGKTCGYTLRMLRHGYLYQYDEHTKRWTAYSVLEDGNLYQLSLDPFHPDPSDPKQMDDPANEVFACSGLAYDASMAMIVTVPDADKATKVWFAHAEVLWTKKIFERHQDPVYRKKNMRLFDVAAWRHSQQHVPNATKLADAGNLLAEFQLCDGDRAKTAYGWSDTPFLFKNKNAQQNLIDNCTALLAHKKYPSAVVALDDPVGMLCDLGELMLGRVYAFNSDIRTNRMRQLAVSSAIDQIYHVVTDNARSEELQAAEQNQMTMMSNGSSLMLITEAGRKLYEDAGKVTDANLTLAAKEEWKRYSNRFDNDAKAAFDKQYAMDLMALDKNHILPLAKAHATIHRDPLTILYFDSNHDDSDFHSGAAFTASYAAAVANVQDKIPCAEVIEEQLQKEIDDNSALALRALMLNRKDLKEKLKEELAKEIKEAKAENVQVLHIPWSAISDAYKSMFDWAEQAEKGASGPAFKLVDLLMNRIGSIALKCLDFAIEHELTYKRTLPTILATMSHTPIVKVELVGLKKDFYATLVEQIMKAKAAKGLSKTALTKAVTDQIKLLGIQGLKMQGSTKKSFIVALDNETLTSLKLSSDMPKQDRPAAIAKVLLSPADLNDMNLARCMEKAESAGVALKEVHVTSVSIIFQIGILVKLYSDMKGAMPDDKKESCWRIGAGVSGLVGFVGEGMESAAAIAGKLELKATRWVRFLKYGRWIGRFGGMFAAAINAWFDKNSALEAQERGEYGLAALYWASVALGLGSTAAFIFASFALWVPIVGWIMLIGLVIVTIFIELNHDNNLQKWLERSFWGRTPGEEKKSKEESEKKKEDNHYKTMEQEMKEFNMALAG